jgi:hypothetical protein
MGARILKINNLHHWPSSLVALVPTLMLWIKSPGIAEPITDATGKRSMVAFQLLKKS